MRHAKSERPPGVADIDRPLADRGRVDAALVGEFLGAALGPAALVLSSPARRARDTALLAMAAAGWEGDPIVDRRLYYGGLDALIDAVSEVRAEVMAAFGHEPVWSSAVGALVGGGSHRMVTAAAACIEFAGPVRAGVGSLSWMVTPASLGGGKHPS